MQIILEDGSAAVMLNFDDLPDTGEQGQTVIVQNLGPGAVYFDRVVGVDEDSGVKIAAAGFWEFAQEKVGAGMYFMADGGDADVRYTVAG